MVLQIKNWVTIKLTPGISGNYENSVDLLIIEFSVI